MPARTLRDQVPTAVDQLARGRAEALSYTKQDGADAVRRRISDKLKSELVSVADWGVRPSNVYIPGTGAKINKALEQAPLGSTLHFSGLYYTEVPILQKRGVNIHFEPGSAVVSIFDDPTKDVWVINIESMPFNAGEARQLRFDNMRITNADGLAARDTLVIENVSPLIGNLQCLFINPNIVAQDGDSAGYAVRFKGLVTQAHIFIGHYVSGGIYLEGCADGCKFLGGIVGGLKPAFTVDLAGGAFKTIIEHNLLVARDGALIVLGGSQIDFHKNQIEQVEAQGKNQNEHSASVIISADSYGSRGISLSGNNFGGSSRVDHHVYVKSDSTKTVEDLDIGSNNTWSKSLISDITLADAGVKYTNIDRKQLLRGARGTADYITYPDSYGANTDDVNTLLNVVDNGTGTAGVRLGATRLGGASATALLNSWTCDAKTHCIKDAATGLVRFSGWATGPAAAQNSITIATLPEGFRPNVEQIIPITGYDLGTGAKVDALVQVQTDGSVVCTRPASTNSVRLGLSVISFFASRIGYNPSY